MHDILPTGPLLAAFFAASLVLAITPGPGVFYIVTRSMLQGRKSGLASVGGVALGNLGNAIGSALGLAALFAVSSTAFLIVKYVGAAYLVYIGIRTLRIRSSDIVTTTPPPASLSKIFRDGFIVALFNPKTAVFFAAFLPQFIEATASPVFQSVTLGTLFVIIAAATDSAYALAAGAVAPLLSRSHGVRASGRYVTGGAFIGMGIFTAFGSLKAEK